MEEEEEVRRGNEEEEEYEALGGEKNAVEGEENGVVNIVEDFFFL